jgi:hypothetical protein
MTDTHGESRVLLPGDGERFVQLFAQNQKRILGYIYSLVPRAQNAEDRVTDLVKTHLRLDAAV